MEIAKTKSSALIPTVPAGGVLRQSSLCLLLGALLAAGSAFAAPPKIIKPGETVCCIGENGQRICGDTPQAQCNGRALKIYNRQGLLVREIPAPMGDEQKAAILAREQQEHARKEAEVEQRRKDQALLDTYSSLADVDLVWQRSESDRMKEINDILSRIGAAQQRLRALEVEAEAAGKPLPSGLDKSLREENAEIKAQNELLAVKRKEMEEKRKRYENDRKRYVELTKQ